GAPACSNNNHSWLWAPAFAGAAERRELLFLLRLLRHALETVLHLLHLLAQIVDVAIVVHRRLWRLLCLAATHARRERDEFREGLLEQLHVAADLLFKRGKRGAAQRAGNLLAEFFLLLRQRRDRLLEIFRHHHLHAVAVEADQLAQERGRQQVLPRLVLLLEDDLRQHASRNVFAGLGVVDEKILAFLYHRREILERHVGARTGIIQPPVGVLLDGGRCVRFCHGVHTRTAKAGNPTALPQG